jgi:hypothetical protein
MGPRATIRCIGAEQMTDDLSDIRTWIHAPEGLIIIGLTTFFVSSTLFESSILPRILPVDRLERQILSDHGGTQLLLEGAKYLCDVNGLHLVGFKFLSCTSRPMDRQPPATGSTMAIAEANQVRRATASVRPRRWASNGLRGLAYGASQ